MYGLFCANTEGFDHRISADCSVQDFNPHSEGHGDTLD